MILINLLLCVDINVESRTAEKINDWGRKLQKNVFSYSLFQIFIGNVYFLLRYYSETTIYLHGGKININISFSEDDNMGSTGPVSQVYRRKPASQIQRDIELKRKFDNRKTNGETLGGNSNKDLVIPVYMNIPVFHQKDTI